MKRAFVLITILLAGASVLAQTPPSPAQIKKDLMNPGVVEIVIRGNGSFEKFVQNRAVVNEYIAA